MGQPVEVAKNVYFVEGPASNWVLLGDAGRFVLVDTGYPGDRESVLGSFKALGWDIRNCCAILVTHAHNDHAGSVAYLQDTFGIPVWCHERERRNLDGSARQEATVKDLRAQLFSPGRRALRIASWARQAIKADGLKYVPATPNVTFGVEIPGEASSQEALALPLRPQPLNLPGHTDGSTAFLVETGGKRVLISGDSLITGHACNGPAVGVQELHPMFHHDTARAHEDYQALRALAPDVILPGHGPAMKKNPFAKEKKYEYTLV